MGRLQHYFSNILKNQRLLACSVCLRGIMQIAFKCGFHMSSLTNRKLILPNTNSNIILITRNLTNLNIRKTAGQDYQVNQSIDLRNCYKIVILFAVRLFQHLQKQTKLVKLDLISTDRKFFIWRLCNQHTKHDFISFIFNFFQDETKVFSIFGSPNRLII